MNARDKDGGAENYDDSLYCETRFGTTRRKKIWIKMKTNIFDSSDG